MGKFQASRLRTHEKLTNTGLPCYYQPPANVKLNYPCIVYHRNAGHDIKADDIRYVGWNSYLVTVIEKVPDSDIPDIVQDSFPHSQSVNYFQNDNLYHSVIKIYNL